MSVRVLLAPTVDLARTLTPDITVEAEYGNHVIEGRIYTAAHHQTSGPYMGRHLPGGTAVSPCNDHKIDEIKDGIILVSHVDLDTFGGCLRALGGEWNELFQAKHQGFWDLAEFIDCHGPHKLGQSFASPKNIERLYAFWAWSKTESPRNLSRDSITDVTDLIQKAGYVLYRIVVENSLEHLERGETFKKAEGALNVSSFVDCEDGVIARKSEEFVSHLYVTPRGKVAQVVVAFNTKTKTVTVSLADPIPGVSAKEIVQALWGSEAGGHAGIAGGPRGKEMNEEDFGAAVRAVTSKLKSASTTEV